MAADARPKGAPGEARGGHHAEAEAEGQEAEVAGWQRLFKHMQR